MKLARLFKNLISLFYPALCVGCGEALVGNEQFFCGDCLPDLPKTNYHRISDNLALERLAGRIPVQKAAAYLYYNKQGLGQKTVAEIKYRGNIRLGKWIGAYLAKDMLASGFLDGVDCIVPVPLHRKKLRQRGFNQAELIARGISGVTGIPLETNNLYRAKANATQTRKGVYERWKNTEGIFQVKNSENFENRHVLLLDDVLTTGSTLEACAQALLQSKQIKLSVLTLAIA